MKKIFLALLLIGFVAQSALFAESFDLKSKKIKVTKKNADIFPGLELRPEPPPGLSNEPKYRSQHHQKFYSTFGNHGIDVAFVVDEKRGTGKGFDFMYVDVSGAGDLTKGKKISGKADARSFSYMDTEFPAFEIQLPGERDNSGYPVMARFSTRKDVPDDSSLYLTPLCVLEGTINLDGKQKKLFVFDANCNGVFGEKAEIGNRGDISGDTIWIGSGSPKVEEACTEADPIGNYLFVDGAYYEAEFHQNHRVDIKKTDVPLGKIRVNNPGYVLELVDGDSVLYVSSAKGQEVSVPVGNYKVNTADFREKYKGKVWKLEGAAGSCSEMFTVKEDQLTEVKVGPPLKVMITSRPLRPMGNNHVASLDFFIEGSAGERYQYLLKGGKKVDLPEISIRNDKNREVDKGGFEYG